MKKIKRIIILSALLFGAIASNAQEKGKVLISTVYDEPNKNVWDVGIALIGLDIQNQTSGGLYYMVHGRYTLGKLFTFSANVGLDFTKIVGSNSLISTSDNKNVEPFTNIEARASFHFKDKEGNITNKVKLGTGVESYGGSSHTVKYSTQYTSKARNIYAATASLNLQNHVGIQVDDSASAKRAIHIKDGSGKDIGFAKGAAVNQKNVVLGVGIFIGQYTHYKGKFTRSTSGLSKTRRINKSISSSIELLIGMSMNMGDKVYFKGDNDLVTKEYSDFSTERKRLGWRITTDYGKGKLGWFQHFELGMRPGLLAPNRQSKWLNQGYINWGVGFGF